MKNLIFLLIASNSISIATAQNKERKVYTHDNGLSRWVLDANLFGGAFTQQMDKSTTAKNYLNGINVNTGNLKFSNGAALGAELQIGYFFGKNKKIGLGTGLLYLRQWGNLSLDNFHAEYQSTDGNGYIFRQVVSSTNISEKIKTDNFNIPLVLKFKNRFSKHWGITADAGVLFNIKMQNNYNTNASLDYEAIYKFENESGTPIPIYDYANIPDKSDFLITKEQFTKNNPSGNLNEYFNTKRDAGYLVGLGLKPNQQSGSTNYNTVSVGFMFQPSVNYFFSDRVALNVGAFILYQPFENNAANNYTLTRKPGEYNSISNSISKIQTQSFGGNLGLRFFLGKSGRKMNVIATNELAPSNCGLCNGSFSLQGLEPNKLVTVKYKRNGKSLDNSFSGATDENGKIVLNNLCAGNYSDIKATVENRSAAVAPINLIEKKLELSLTNTTMPSAQNKCDGAINIGGLNPGQTAKINYELNELKVEQTVVVAPDGSAQFSGLCSGSFSKISIMSNNCFATLENPSIILLEAVKEIDVPDDSLKHVLFDFNESTIRSYSYSLINDAYDKLAADKDAYLIIDGNTDKIGTEEYNQQLSIRRANAVRDYLITKGIDSSRISIIGNGEREPVAPNNTGLGRRKNRRAEMIIKIR